MISVIVPVFGVEDRLDGCVRSVLAQTCREFELILVDDGSRDRCGEICDAWAARDGRVRVIHQANGGLSSARNAGIDAAGGKYIAFVDADDYLLPGYLGHLLELFRLDPSARYVECGFYTERDGRRVASCRSLGVERLDAVEAVRRMLYHRGPDVASWGKLFRREVFATLRFPEGHIHEDVAVAGEYRCRPGGTVYSGSPLYVYVIRRGSITAGDATEESAGDYLSAAGRLCAQAAALSGSLGPACRRFAAYSRMRALRELVESGSVSADLPRRLRAEALRHAFALLTDGDVPVRDKAGLLSLMFGLRAYRLAWRVYVVFRSWHSFCRRGSR